MQAEVDALIELLDLEPIEEDIFRGVSPQEDRQRVFGGQVAGQALVAATRTVEDRSVHSLQAYFIRPGDVSAPLVYLVERVRDGRSFTTRRVTAIQHGQPIFAMSASFPQTGRGIRAPNRSSRGHSRSRGPRAVCVAGLSGGRPGTNDPPHRVCAT